MSHVRIIIHLLCYVFYEEIGDKASELDALLQLGQLKKESRLFDEALRYYDEANNLAEDEGDIGYMKRVARLIGVCQGDRRLDENMQKLRQRPVR